MLFWRYKGRDSESNKTFSCVLETDYREGQVWVRNSASLNQRLECLNEIVNIERNRMMKSNIVYRPSVTPRFHYADRHTYLKLLAKGAQSVVTVYLEHLGK